MLEADAVAFGLSTWSKCVLWFLAAVSSGLVALLLSVFIASLHTWSDIDSRALFALPILLLLYFGAINLRYLFIKGPLLSIGASGIEDKLSGFGFIPWDEITGVVASVVFIRGGVYKTLYLKVKNSGVYYSRVNWLVRLFLPLRWFRKDFLAIRFSYLDGTMDDALESIHAFRPFLIIDQISK